MKVLVTRPHPDDEETAHDVAALGFAPMKDPVLRVEPRDWLSPDWDNIDGIIISSKNALTGFAGHAMPKHKPYYVVGERTAQALRKMGLIHVTGTVERSDDLPALINLQHKPGEGRFVHLTAPHTHNAFYDVLRREGFIVEPIVIYEAVAATALQPQTIAALKNGEIGIALFYSARSAEIFIELAAKAGVAKKLKQVRALCLSDAVADSCQRDLWAAIDVAKRPTQKHLLECLANT